MRMIRMIMKSRKIMIWICRVIVDTTQVHNNNNISTTTILTSLEESIKMSNSTYNISMSATYKKSKSVSLRLGTGRI